MADSRIYFVDGAIGVNGPDRGALVRATSKAQAIRYYVSARVGASVATQEMLVSLLINGMTVQDATKDHDATP